MTFLGKGEAKIFGARIAFNGGEFTTHDPNLAQELIRRGYAVKPDVQVEEMVSIEPPAEISVFDAPITPPKPRRGRPAKDGK